MPNNRSTGQRPRRADLSRGETPSKRRGQEEGRSDRHVKNCAKIAQHLQDVCKPGLGMEWLRNLILQESFRYQRRGTRAGLPLTPGGAWFRGKGWNNPAASGRL